MLLVILQEKKLFELFTKKNSKETNQKEFRNEEVIKRKGNKLEVKCVKWESYHSSFNPI